MKKYPTISGFSIVLITILVLLSCAAYAQGNSDTLYAEVNELVKGEKLDEAVGLLKKHLAGNRSDPIAMTLLGSIYKKKGERKAALKYLKKAVKVDPDYPFAHFYLGQLYFLTQEQGEAVAQLALYKEKMRPLLTTEEMRKTYVGTLHYICEVYFTYTMFKDAKREIAEILTINPKDQTAFYNLGIYYYKYERNRSRAYDSFKKALDIDTTTYIGRNSRYAIEFIRTNPDPRVAPDFSFVDQEYKE